MDLHKHLVEMPAPMAEMSHRKNPTLSDFTRENRPEPVPPNPHRLMGNIDPALVKKVLDVPQRQRAPDIQHYR